MFKCDWVLVGLVTLTVLSFLGFVYEVGRLIAKTRQERQRREAKRNRAMIDDFDDV